MLRPSPVPWPSGLVVKNGSNTCSQHVGRHAAAGVGDREHHILARRDVRMARGVGIVEHGVAGLDRQLAVAVHRVARVDRQIEQRVLDLERIDQRVPQAARHDRLDLDPVAERAPQHVVQAAHEAAEIDDLRRQRLAPAEGQQLRGELRSRARRRPAHCAGAAPPSRYRRRRRTSSCRLPPITCSRLLKSWATPPVSLPIASIFWASRSASSAWRSASAAS